MNISEAFTAAPVLSIPRDISNEITLTGYEMFTAAMIGVRRQIGALQNGCADSAGFEGLGWNIHVEGAAGEMAYARFRDRYWSGSVGTFKEGGDVGDVQIRTRSKSDYDLIVRDADRDDDFFVLVVGTAPRFRVVGWIRGGEAKQPQWRQEHGGRPGAYFVPQAALHRFEAQQ